MTKTLKVALAQIAPAWLDRESGVDRVISAVEAAAREGARLIVFGEATLPGYPFWVDVTGGATFNSEMQKELFAFYSDQAVIVEDGHLDPICAALAKAEMAAYLGIIERPRDRSGHSLYCSLVYIDATGTVRSVHRKLQPTYEERLVWAPGDGHGLVTHRLGEFTVGGLNCWENWMPLSRAALYGQGEDLHVAVWPGGLHNTEDITPFLAKEGRSFSIAGSSLMRTQDVGDHVPFAKEIREGLEPLAANGGSCIAAPDGSWVLPPLVGEEGLRFAELDPEWVRRERHNFDPAGHYSRPDVTHLVVNRERQAIERRTRSH